MDDLGRAIISTWRVGRKVGRTIYAQLGSEASDDDRLIGVMDTPSLARAAVTAANGDARLKEEVERLRAVIAELVRLKDGPRDDAYRSAKESAWEAARAVALGEREDSGRMARAPSLFVSDCHGAYITPIPGTDYWRCHDCDKPCAPVRHDPDEFQPGRMRGTGPGGPRLTRGRAE